MGDLIAKHVTSPAWPRHPISSLGSACPSRLGLRRSSASLPHAPYSTLSRVIHCLSGHASSRDHSRIAVLYRSTHASTNSRCSITMSPSAASHPASHRPSPQPTHTSTMLRGARMQWPSSVTAPQPLHSSRLEPLARAQVPRTRGGALLAARLAAHRSAARPRVCRLSFARALGAP